MCAHMLVGATAASDTIGCVVYNAKQDGRRCHLRRCCASRQVLSLCMVVCVKKVASCQWVCVYQYAL